MIAMQSLFQQKKMRDNSLIRYWHPLVLAYRTTVPYYATCSSSGCTVRVNFTSHFSSSCSTKAYIAEMRSYSNNIEDAVSRIRVMQYQEESVYTLMQTVAQRWQRGAIESLTCASSIEKQCKFQCRT
jgi:hypothetical protein